MHALKKVCQFILYGSKPEVLDAAAKKSEGEVSQSGHCWCNAFEVSLHQCSRED